MRRLFHFSAALAMMAMPWAWPAMAQVGVTSATAGDPLGQPPAAQERVLRVGVDVVANERVTTRADDRAHLVFFDSTSLTVGPNSAITIDKYVYDPAAKKGEISLNATKGVFRLVGGTISKNSEMKVTTPSATIGIRGGIAAISVAENGSTTAAFLYGQSMTVTNQGQTQTTTRNGSEIHVDVGRPPAAPTIIPPQGNIPGAVIEKPAALTPLVPAVVTGAPPIVVAARPTVVAAPTVVVAPVVTATLIEQTLDKTELSKRNGHMHPRALREYDERHEGQANHQSRGTSASTSLQVGATVPKITAVVRLTSVAVKGVTQATSKNTSSSTNKGGSANHR